MSLLELDRLSKHYGGVHALKNISLSLQPGTVLGLVGDNGAGKSTLMKCITGAEKPDDGTIYLDGKPLTPGNAHTSRLAGVEMIYQNLDLCLNLDAVTNIFLGRELKKRGLGLLDRKAMVAKAEDILRRINADIPATQPTGLLSGGQQQAVAIARALLFEPKLLIMDEPTAALGVREVAKVLALIKSLKSEGITIIIISHRLGDIYEVADRLVLMRRGEIRHDTPINQISLEEATRQLIA